MSILLAGAKPLGGKAVDVLIEDGTITGVGAKLAASNRPDERIDCSGLVLLPGFVDLHTHLREPGREDAETVATGSAAAALGGYTDTEIGRVVTIAFIDAYTQMVNQLGVLDTSGGSAAASAPQRTYRTTQATPLPVLPIAWTGRKRTQRDYRAMCDAPGTLSKNELDRRVAAFGRGDYGHDLTVTLHGHKFHYVAPETAMSEPTKAPAGQEFTEFERTAQCA